MKRMMILCVLGGILIFPICFFILSTPQHHAEATVALGNPDPMAQGCAVNFTRLQPHYCSYNNVSSLVLTSNGACQSADLNATFGVPASATLARVVVSHSIFSANVVVLRQTRLTIMSDSGCTITFIPSTGVDMREQVISGTGNQLWTGTIGTYDVKLISNAVMKYVGQLTNCTGCSIAITLLGYYD